MLSEQDNLTPTTFSGTMRAQYSIAIIPAVRFVTGIIVILLIWQAAAWLVHKSIVPLPLDTLRLFVNGLVSFEVLIAAWQTFIKVVLVLMLAILIGIPLGLCLGLSNPIYDICRPGIMIIQAVPVISWLSLVIFAWGIGWKGPVFIATVSLLPISILTTVSGVRNLDEKLLEMARVYRVRRADVVKDIYLGALMPFIAAILDVSIGQAWKVILVTEYLCGGKGLGEEILMARMNIDFTRVWAITLIAVSLGIAMERITKILLRRLSQRWTLV